ncbi:MAG: FAD-dependent oxidoreductase [Gammaproteobacteria bacterium]
MKRYDYCVVGAGLAGASAIGGIRELDPHGSIALFGAENRLPYHRPPLSKGLWFGKKQPHEIDVVPGDELQRKGIDLHLDRPVLALDRSQKTLHCGNGDRYAYGKLLLAQGGLVRTLDLPGAADERILYLRTLDDYQRIRAAIKSGVHAAVVGGGFIGSEMACALAEQPGVRVTHILSGAGPLAQVLPTELSRFLTGYYQKRGIQVLAGTRLQAVMPDNRLQLELDNGTVMEADCVVAGSGIRPDTTLAQAAGLELDDGVVVDRQLRTSDPDIFAAGDLARYPDPVHGTRIRIEHWDNARATGHQAGRNMAGAGEDFAYQSMFFSDLFDLGFEAVGELDARLETFADWEEEFRKGVIYYLRDGTVVGVLLWNVWDKVDAARALIAEKRTVHPQELKGRIR